MANLRQYSITLDQARNYQEEIYTDPKTGIRYAFDTFGNPIIIAPDEPGQVPDKPGKGGFTYERAKAQMTPETMEFTDVGGNVVRLTETDIRPYLFDPSLIQRESDLALLSGKAAEGAEPIGTTLDRGEFEGREESAIFEDPFSREGKVKPGEGGYVRLMPGAEGEPEKVSGEESQRIKAASERIDQRAGVGGPTPPGGPELPEAGDFDWFKPGIRDDYKNYIIQRMGGNPNTINAHEEIQKMMPDSRVQSWYIDNWQPGMKTWFDLSKQEQAQIGTKLRSDLLYQYTQELKAKQDVFNREMAEFDKKVDAHQKAIKMIESMVKGHLGEMSRIRREETTAKGKANTLKRDILKYQKELGETFDDARKQQLEAHLKDLKSQLRDMEGGAKADGKEKPISTAPKWATEFAKDRKIVMHKEDARGKFVKVIENGKEVTYGLESGKTEWVKMTPGKSKQSTANAAVEGAKSVGMSFTEE